jgi:NADH-quinone oxidoreductase subunit C
VTDVEPGDEADAPVDEQAAATDAVEKLFDIAVTTSCGQTVLHPSRDELVALVLRLRDDEGFFMCTDVCGVDYLTYEAPRGLADGVAPERFEVVVGLLNMEKRQRVRIRVQVPADDPTCPSLFDVHPGTEAMEREAFDLFGIRFEGHPDLTRILMPEDWEGHPLRKDYPVGRIPVQFKGVTNAR